MENKEYKIITSRTPIFSNSQKLKQVLAEEAEAGWDLYELRDSSQIRVSRDKSARSNDANCRIDPYRMVIGMNSAAYFAIASIVTVGVIYAIIQLAAYSVS